MSAVVSTVKVIIVGAGFGGLCMAAALKKAGTDSFVLLEEGDDVGGIWRENTYPGCGCDVPSHLYSFSFEKYRSTTLRYPSQPDILEYLRHVSRKYGLRAHLRTNARAESASYDADTRKWTVHTAAGDVFEADIVVSAVGQLHRPSQPALEGHETFSGPAFHTARWDDSTDLSGRDVAVIGNGSSAAQLLPIVARQARSVRMYQRTPNWVIPKPAARFGAPTRWLFRLFPFLQSWYRWLIYLAADLALAPVVTRGWSFRPATWIARWNLRRNIADPALRAKLTPDYPIGCKRIVIDSDFYPALNRANVELVTTGINRITATGIETADGQHHPADVIVYATGFRATEFLVPMQVTGRDGLDLGEQWQAGAEAYLGIAVPGFPNFFMIHGPNTILGQNSNVFMIECQVHYIMNCLRMLPGAIEVNADAMDGYRRWLEQAIGRTVWPAGCLSWYKTASGRVTNPWPATTLRYRALTRRDPARVFTSS